MTRIIIALILVLMVSTFSHADWSETVTLISDEDTIILSDNSESIGSKTNYISFERLADAVLEKANTPTVQADDPTVSSDNGIYFSTISQKMFIKDDGFLWASSAGTYTLIEEVVVPEYTLNLNISGVTGADAINGFTTSQVITGLTSDYTLTGVLGDSTDLACTGTGVTGSGLSYLAGTASADVTTDCVFSTASGGSCDTQSIDTAHITTDSQSADIFENTVYGQSYTPLSTGSIYAIRLVAHTLNYPDSTNITVRVGDTIDLSTVYESEATVSTVGKVAGDSIDVVFSSMPTQVAGVTKYFTVSGLGYNERFKLYIDNNDVFAGGTLYKSTTGIADLAVQASDFSFEVLLCD